jgi:hypothetical protein
METTVPVSIAVCGNSLIETVLVSCLATEGMIPQALLFKSAGGVVETELTSPQPDQVVIRYDAKVRFALPGWGVIETRGTHTIAEQGNQIVVDPAAWIKHLTVHLLLDDVSCGESLSEPQDYSQDYLVINIVWKGPHLKAPVKQSERLTPSKPLQFTYIRDPQKREMSATLTTFGVLHGKPMRMPASSVNLEQSLVSIVASHNAIRLMT